MPNIDKTIDWLAHRRNGLLIGLLLLLHLTLLAGMDTLLGRILMVAHIGLFFLWQPFVRAEQRLTTMHLFFIVLFVAAAAIFLKVWLMMLWVMLLAGIIGGKVFVFGGRWPRIFHLLALAYLVAILLILLPPLLLPVEAAVVVPIDLIARYGLPGIFLLMLSLPRGEEAAERPDMIDFAYSIFIILLLAVLVLGTLAGMLLMKLGYVESLFAVLLVMGSTLLFLGWSWDPRGGFSGMSTFLSRYLLSASLPFELWVEALATYPAEKDEPPTNFIAWACRKLLREVPWLLGIAWTTDDAAGQVGEMAGQRMTFAQPGLRLVVCSHHPLTPALVWQFNILLQLLGEFYRDRLRIRQLRQLSYLQAIYETGSRLTHDVKNILQSLHTLCAAVAAEESTGSKEFHGLLQRQLPAIAQRLQQTLEKLGQPAAESPAGRSAGEWWRKLQLNHEGLGIEFRAEAGLAGRQLPAGLFSTAVENLLQNALAKKRLYSALRIVVRLVADGDGLVLEVGDDGTAIPAGLASQLGRAPVASESGLGIGLYQVGRAAAAGGYRLDLVENRDGCVRFELRAETETQA